MKKFVILLFSVVIVASLIFVACGAPTAVPTKPEEPTPGEPSVPQVPPEVPGAEYPEEVVIGCPMHITGPLGMVSKGQIIAGDLALEEINAAGGIKNMGGAKLSWLHPDTQLVPDIAVSETERLITQEGVVDIIATYMHGEEVALTSQRFKCPCTQFQTIMPPTMSEEDWYVSRVFNDEDEDFFDNQAAYTLWNEEKGVEGPHSIAFLYGSNTWATEASAWGPPMFTDWGYDVVLEIPYVDGQATFKSEIAKIKTAKPDHLILFMQAEHPVFNRELMEEQVDLPYGMITQGGENSEYYAIMPPEAYEYQFIHEDGDIWYPYRCYGDKLAQAHMDGTGLPLATYATNIYQGMFLIAQALERTVYSADIQTFRDNFQKAYLATDISLDNCPTPRVCDDGTPWCPELIRGSPTLSFEPSGHVKGREGHACLSQWRNGRRVPMWPQHMRPPEAEWQDLLVWPIPSWSER